MLTYKWDKWAKFYGCDIPHGAIVECIRSYRNVKRMRKVLIRYNGKLYLTMPWCVVQWDEVEEG